GATAAAQFRGDARDGGGGAARAGKASGGSLSDGGRAGRGADERAGGGGRRTAALREWAVGAAVLATTGLLGDFTAQRWPNVGGAVRSWTEWVSNGAGRAFDRAGGISDGAGRAVSGRA